VAVGVGGLVIWTEAAVSERHVIEEVILQQTEEESGAQANPFSVLEEDRNETDLSEAEEED